MRSRVISIFLYACESMTLTAELKKRTQTFEDEMLLKVTEHLVQASCQQRRCSQKDPITHWETCRTPDLGQEPESKVVFWHISRSSCSAKTTLQLLNSYVKTILQGRVKGKRTKKIIRKGRQKKLKTRTGGKGLL